MFRCVVEFESFSEPSGFDGREGLVERSFSVGVEIVLHQDDCLGLGEMDIGQLLEHAGITDGGVVTLTFRQPSSGANIMKRLAVPLRSYS